MSTPRSIHEGDSHSTPHTSHEADALHAGELHGELNDVWVEPKNFDAPAPREGMVQRWVRYAHGDGDDLINLQYMMRKGWRPRPVSTIEKKWLEFPTITHATLGDVVAVAGCILCEMPESQALKIRRAVRQRTQNLELAVNDETDRTSRLAESRGHPRIVRREKLSTTRRQAPIQAD